MLTAHRFIIPSLILSNSRIVCSTNGLRHPHTDSNRELTPGMAGIELLTATPPPAAVPSPALPLSWSQLHPSWGSGLPGP